MDNEILIEEGIVTKVFHNNDIEITLIESDRCETCGTKDFCKGSNIKTIVVKNYQNLSLGDKVLIEVKGTTILQTVVLLYGIPLVIIILSFFFLYPVIETNKELIVTSIAFFMVGLYYLLLKSVLKDLVEKYRVEIKKLD